MKRLNFSGDQWEQISEILRPGGKTNSCTFVEATRA